MDQQVINNVIRTVRSSLPPECDVEMIAIDIIMEAYKNGVEPPTRVHIRSRCYDELRRLKGEKEHMKDYKRYQNEPEPEPETIQRYMSTLDNTERKVIFLRFYADQPISEVAKTMKMANDKVRSILANAIFKMRSVDEGDE